MGPLPTSQAPSLSTLFPERERFQERKRPLKGPTGFDSLNNGSRARSGNEFTRSSAPLSLPLEAEEAFRSRPNAKIVYDPELSKSKSRGDAPIYRTFGEPTEKAKDPRMAALMTKSSYLKAASKGKRSVFGSLPVPKLTYDKYSVGPAPDTQILISHLSPLTPRSSVVSKFQQFGSIEKCEMINDPTSGMFLGLCYLRFKGKPDVAHDIAKRAVSESSNKLKIDSKIISVEFDEEGKKGKELVDSLVKARIKQEREKARELEKLKEQEKLKAQSARSRLQALESQKKIQDMVGNKPYIMIRDKYLPTSDVYPSDLKRYLRQYDWKRVISDHRGFYVIFDSFKEAKLCHRDMDGRRLFEYRLHMDLYDHGKMDNSVGPAKPNQGNLLSERTSVIQAEKRQPVDPVNEGLTRIMTELEDAFLKDIKQRVVLPTIFESLNLDKYREVLTDLRAKKEAEANNAVNIASITSSGIVDGVSSDVNRLSLLPRFKKKTSKIAKARPMSYKLNYSSDEDNDVATPRRTPMDADVTASVDDVKKKRKPGVAKKDKLQPVGYTSSEGEDNQEPALEVKKQRANGISSDTSDVEMEEAKKAYPVGDVSFAPTDSLTPLTVCKDDLSTPISLSQLQELIRDEEDFAFLKSALSSVKAGHRIVNPEFWAWHTKSTMATYDKQLEDLLKDNIGSADTLTTSWNYDCFTSRRSEGYFKIPEAEKVQYLPHRRKLNVPIDTLQKNSENETSKQLASSRMNRFNNRRLAADISIQKQMLSSETDLLNFNQLMKRRKPVKFARSAIHNWGLYAVEPIFANEMIIEYVGEIIRQPLADLREKNYIRAGIGSSYLFRIEDTTVVDATKRGGIARFINHSCTPSCTAKIIKVEGQKRIVIYALRDVGANEELTYDYKFERELNGEERIPCLCGSPACKGFLN